jgi:hypothetical protein
MTTAATGAPGRGRLPQKDSPMAADEPDDQLRTTTYGVVRGAMTQMTPSTMKSLHPANSIYTFSKAFSWNTKHGLIQFHRGQSYYLDPALKAALLAAGAPITAA